MIIMQRAGAREEDLKVVLPARDAARLRKLNVNLTCDPEFSSKSLFIYG